MEPPRPKRGDGVGDVTEATVRRWLALLRHPNRLDSPEMRALLHSHGRLPVDGTPLDVGRAAARLLSDMIDRLIPPFDAPAAERLPYDVLHTCFVQGAKLHQAAAQLGMSERQLTRERRRAISLLTAQLSLGRGAPRFVPDGLPVVENFIPRPDVVKDIEAALARARCARVHGPRGIGKTSIAADFVTGESRGSAVWWHRFRRGVNDTLGAVMFELAQWLAGHGLSDLASYVTPNPGGLDATVAARIAIRALGETNALLVLDDYHVAEHDLPVTGFFEEALTRAPTVKLVTLSGRRPRPGRDRGEIEIRPFQLEQTEKLLVRAGVRPPRELLAKIHAWTAGNPHLVNLAARWLEGATSQEAARGIEGFVRQQDVHAFLVETLSEVDVEDRDLVDAASVFRLDFSQEALGYVADRTRGLADAVNTLMRAYVFAPRPTGGATFFHRGTRDYVYDRLGSETRSRFHLRAAAWYHQVGDAAETAYHRERGGLRSH